MGVQEKIHFTISTKKEINFFEKLLKFSSMMI